MGNVKIIVGTSKVGSEHRVDSGYSIGEWLSLTDDEQSDIINEKVWDVIHAYADIDEAK